MMGYTVQIMMKSNSETFGIESGYGKEVIEWINGEARKDDLNFEARTYDYEVATQNFGSFEMFSWIGDIQTARKLIVKASKRFKIKVIEGGFKTKERILKLSKQDYAMVRRGDKVIGHIAFTAPMLGGQWQVTKEELR
jgi:hypothetical protein